MNKIEEFVEKWSPPQSKISGCKVQLSKVGFAEDFETDLQTLLQQAVEEERERCAKIVEEFSSKVDEKFYITYSVEKEIAKSIRNK